MFGLVALVPLLLCVSASPVEKRFTRSLIVSGRDGKCLVAQSPPGVGSQVYSADCATTVGSKYWNINPGSGSVILSGTENSKTPLALDAGSNPGNNGGLKVWQSYPGLYQQTWYLTNDNRIAITGGNQCLDEGDNGIQTYQCTTGNTNQVFYIKQGSAPASSSSKTAPSSTSVKPSSTSSTTKPSGTGQAYRIHPGGDKTKCVAIQSGYDGVGSLVAISGCGGPGGGEFSGEFEWTFVGLQGGSSAIKSTGSNGLCLDAGNNPANGSGMKVYTCYDGLLQQTWKYDGRQLTVGNGQALDVVAGSGPQNRKPYGSLQDLQTWQASTNQDPQQYFTFEAVA